MGPLFGHPPRLPSPPRRLRFSSQAENICMLFRAGLPDRSPLAAGSKAVQRRSHGQPDRPHANLQLSFIPPSLLLLLVLPLPLPPGSLAPFLHSTCESCAWGSRCRPAPLRRSQGASESRAGRSPHPGAGFPHPRAGFPLSPRQAPLAPWWIWAREGDLGKQR